MSKKHDPPEATTPLAEPRAEAVQQGAGSWQVLKGGVLHKVVDMYQRTSSLMPQRPVFMLKDGTGFVRMHPEDIIHIQAKGNYVEIHRPRSRVVVHSSLSEVLKALPPGIMVRINRGQAVNLRRIDHIASEEVILADMVFTLSRHYRDDLLKQLKIITDRSTS